MVIFDLFSKRQKRLQGDIPDVYTYDALPSPLRVQVVHIWKDALGNERDYHLRENISSAYEFIVDTLCREYGLFELPTTEPYGKRHYLNELSNFLLQEKNVNRVMDAIELSFKLINKSTRDYGYLRRPNASNVADQAITELNNRFKEHGIGFQFIENEIIRVDSELLHVEAVKPALKLLNESKFSGAQQEFLSAYEHYRHGKNKESLNDCLKAFESTMKAICDKRNWSYQKGATAKTLIQICFDNNLVPSFWQLQFGSLRSLLESSIPTGRNNLSGHGQGASPTAVPDYLVAYMLHMTASTLVFLITADKNIA